VAVTDTPEDWHYDDRYFLVTLASTPTSMDLELNEVGSAEAAARRKKGTQGPILLASCDDDSQGLTLSVFTTRPLPLELVERFVTEARRRLPGRA
jgi:hypothetical protein